MDGAGLNSLVVGGGPGRPARSPIARSPIARSAIVDALTGAAAAGTGGGTTTTPGRSSRARNGAVPLVPGRSETDPAVTAISVGSTASAVTPTTTGTTRRSWQGRSDTSGLLGSVVALADVSSKFGLNGQRPIPAKGMRAVVPTSGYVGQDALLGRAARPAQGCGHTHRYGNMGAAAT